MRLLNVHTFQFELFERDTSPYAILSHRWTGAEPRLGDIQRCGGELPSEYVKVCGFAKYTMLHFNLDWIWIDSCCINQDSAAELTEGVNRMFAWYRNAQACLVYLFDVDHAEDDLAFSKSVWFKRGWTLQELLASRVVIFVTSNWDVIGHKGRVNHLHGVECGPNIEPRLSEVTSIPVTALQDFSNTAVLDTRQVSRWMEGRQTFKEEDMVYALFGIFGVMPGANYGEGKHNAEIRLLDAIERRTAHGTTFRGDDMSAKAELKALLPSSDSTKIRETEQRRRIPNTCEYLLASEKYMHWKEEASVQRALWCSGSPGSGKSVFAAAVVQDLLHTHEVVLSVFCRHDDQERQDGLDFVLNLLRQVIDVPSHSPRSSLLEFYRTSKAVREPNAPDTRPDIEKSTSLLIEELKQFDTSWIIVDALDECSDVERIRSLLSSRRELLHRLQRLLNEEDLDVRVLLTTRPDPDLYEDFARALERTAVAPLDVYAPASDIELFLEAKIQSRHNISRLKMDQQIREAIVGSAAGMFLLASCHWELIKDAPNAASLKRRLRELPPDVADHYSQTMLRIDGQQSEIKHLAHQVLSWVYHAKRPLTLRELQHALATIDSADNKFDDECITPKETLITTCIGLVVVEADDTVRFAHTTVKEFLDRSEHVPLCRSEQDLAVLSLQYLTLDDFTNFSISPETMQQRMKDMSFLRYAANFWYRHDLGSIKDAQRHQQMQALAEKLFCNDAYFLNWLRVHNPDPAMSWLGECPWFQLKDASPRTLYTSQFGLHDLTRKLSAQDEQSKRAQLGELAGHLVQNHLKEAEQLLDRGVSTGPAFLDHDGTPLLMRCTTKEAFSLLLDRGGNPNSRDFRGWNALQCAARNGDLEAVRFLHSRGAHVPLAEGEESAMHHAVYFGHLEIVKWLLEHGAWQDVNVSGEMGLLPHFAAGHGQPRILELLVKHGADLEKPMPAGKSTLSVVQCLMGLGYHYSLQGRPSGWGMGTEHLQVAIYLLDGEASEAAVSTSQIKSARGGRAETLLHWAVREGYDEVVRLGLEKGVDTTARCMVKQDGQVVWLTALELARELGRTSTVAMLL